MAIHNTNFKLSPGPRPWINDCSLHLHLLMHHVYARQTTLIPIRLCGYNSHFSLNIPLPLTLMRALVLTLTISSIGPLSTLTPMFLLSF